MPAITITTNRHRVEALAAEAGPPFAAHLANEISIAQRKTHQFRELTWSHSGRNVHLLVFGVRPPGGEPARFTARLVGVTVENEIAEHLTTKIWLDKVRGAIQNKINDFANEAIRELGADDDFPVE